MTHAGVSAASRRIPLTLAATALALTCVVAACGSAASPATAAATGTSTSGASGSPTLPASASPSLAPTASASRAPSPAGPSVASAQSQIVRFTMAGPWVGGQTKRAPVGIYLPPGYDPSGRTRYPVIYEAPWAVTSWSVAGRLNISTILDKLIGARQVPPEIVVFLNVTVGPYLDPECADSFDKRAHIETWIVNTVVPWMDSHYPTVATRAGRAVMGLSQGGYCAAALWSHHPDVFGAAIVESGYFTSGIRSAETPNAWRPFGNNAAYMRAQSPINVVPGISATLCSASLVLLEGNPREAFYGPQLNAFTQVLTKSGAPYQVFPDAGGHSWSAWARETPKMLVSLARWMAAQGIS